MMVDSTLAQVGKNLSEAMRILGDGQREAETGPEKWRRSRTSIPGPLQGVGQDVGTILHLVHNLIHDEEEEEDKPSQQRMQHVGEQGHMALLGHSLAAYISVLDRERLRKLTTRILSDTTLWLCRLFRYENGSAYFHEDERDGLVKVCRLVINARYEEYASEGYSVLSSRQPVIYQSASGRPGLGQHLCSQLGLPLSSLCTVPCNTIFGSQHQMDVALLDKLIKEDVEAGKLPLLLIANAGTPGAGHTDKLARLKDLCDQYSMWLHVEGVNLATLALGQVTSAIMAASRSDSMTLTPGQWLGLPAVTAVTLYRHEDPAMVEDELSSPVVLFRFSQEMSSASSVGSVEAYCAGEKEVLDSFNRWLGEELLQLVPTSGLDVVELEDEGTCVRFSPLLTAAVLGTQEENVEDLMEKLSELVPVMCSTMCLRQDFKEETHRRSPSLRYIEELSWPGLGAVRYEPQAEGIDESRRKQELEKINSELLRKLQDLDTDIIFSTGPEFGTEEDCIFVGMVTEDVDVSELVNTVAALGRDIEESGRLLENMTEVVRKGILEAELQLQQANEEKLIEEGMLRQLPLVGSVLNWFSPFQSSIKGRTFNLAAGSLDSTETTYSTKAQPGRPSLQESPTSSSKKQPGQRLFRRSGAGSDSFSETSSIGPAEETTREASTPLREESTPPSGSIQPPASPPAPEEDSHTAGVVVPESLQESSVQVQTQLEDEVASEESQPEGREVEQSGS
ncbi:pyridoxal-dependent decarboxylase domain-containing protein 1 isoform X2 [Cyclopterus lumpus]|uniref:pyridoxal-dependent decarboxylase domain-containing protein 1 isoform X2 n=1 Tax=Cyclopterus lumpus TaxID=8103 RepID=UPI001486BDF8|nr:pyridoxal-dependent decarboxylase domain-containing protein 1 isoform X2 [Cyclopterus lumpus]